MQLLRFDGDLTENIHSQISDETSIYRRCGEKKIKKREMMMMKGPGVSESDTKDGEEKGLAKL